MESAVGTPARRVLALAGASVMILLAFQAGEAVDAAQVRPDLVVVSDGLEADPAIRACLGDPAGYDAREELEPHAAMHPRNPDHLVAAWMARVEGQPGAILAAVSRDGGATWGRPSALPIGTCAGGSDNLPATSDPWVSIGPEGRVYVTAMGWKPGESLDSASVVTVVTSTDGGDTWSGPIAASTARFPDFMHDNTAVLADPAVPGRAWITTTRISDEGWPAGITSSTDGGRAWSPLRLAIPASRDGLAPQPVRGGERLYVFYGHGDDGSRISFVRLSGDGASWSDPVRVHDGSPVDGPVTFPGTDIEIAVAPDIMHPASDPETGDLYLVFTAADPTDPTRPVVWLSASRDEGASWTAPVAVADSGVAAWRPTLAVAPGGPAVVTFFRATPDATPSDSVTLPTDVRMHDFRSGPTGELTRTVAVTLDRFDWLPRYTGTHFLGDYHGLVASASQAVAVFSRSVDRGSRIVAVRQALP